MDIPEGRRTDRLALLRRFARLARTFFLYGTGNETRMFVVLLLLLSLAAGGVQLMVSFAGRNFITSLAQRDTAHFYRNLWIYLGTFAIAVPVGVYYRYCADRLSLLWRLWLTKIMVGRFLFHHAFYRLRQSGRVDNPDQRISEDIRSFTTGVLGYLLTLVNSVVTMLAFTGVLFSISWKLPAVLFLYAGAGTALSILIGRRLVGMHFVQNQREADFRYALVRVRDNAEGIAFLHGEKNEQQDLLTRFGGVVDNTLRIIGWNRMLGFFTSSYSYVALLVPLLIVGPMFIQGRIEFGVVTQTEGAFAQVLMAISVIVVQFEGLSNFAASINRLGDLWEEMDRYDIEDFRAKREQADAVIERAGTLRFNDLTTRTPDREITLTRDLTFALPEGKSVLIMGESGCGKSSLLRTIAGIWTSGEGTIERPPFDEIMILPQRPYVRQGSLREQLLYPQSEAGPGDRKVLDVLGKVNLSGVLDRVQGDLDRVQDWPNILSLGEQQRLSFGRLLLRHPVLAFLDEATSAVDEESERLLYSRLIEAKIPFVSVGQRKSLEAFHDYLIVLDKQGTYAVSELHSAPSRP